jgi:hypothetical protein
MQHFHLMQNINNIHDLNYQVQIITVITGSKIHKVHLGRTSKMYPVYYYTLLSSFFLTKNKLLVSILNDLINAFISNNVETCTLKSNLSQSLRLENTLLCHIHVADMWQSHEGTNVKISLVILQDTWQYETKR